MRSGNTLRVALAVALVLAAAAAFRVVMSNLTPVRTVPGAGSPADAGKAAHPSLLYGRVTMSGGAVYEGRLRFGGDQEAFWGDAFNGQRADNLWVRHVPPSRLRRTTHPVSILGVEVAEDEDEVPLTRPMMARLGDLARIEVQGRRIGVTLKSGAAMDVDYDEANDFDDGVRVWDAREGVVDLNAQWIKVIEFLPAPEPTSNPAPARLYGVMRTRGGEFKGFIQWNRRASLADDTLHVGAGEDADIRFGRVRAIVRRSPTSASVILDDGSEIPASEPGDVGRATRGTYVEDPRYGRVLVPWHEFERIDFSEGGPGPSYRDFAPGGPIRGRVIANDGRALEGRLVFDLDESEVTETLDAPVKGIDYSIPFALVAAIDLTGRDGGAAPDHVAVTLVSGEELRFDRSGDLSSANGGLLVFGEDSGAAQYLQWAEVRRIEIGSPAPSGSR